MGDNRQNSNSKLRKTSGQRATATILRSQSKERKLKDIDKIT
jgi:hypothetical protein